jgi:hypothetical protein
VFNVPPPPARIILAPLVADTGFSDANSITNFNLLNDDFGRVIAVLDPLVAQIGLRVTF